MTAVISSCGLYRYRLERPIEQRHIEAPTTIMWVMLNPSTADATKDDATIRKCRGFSERWGYNKMLVGNLFAWRATKPAGLWAHHKLHDIIGPETNAHLAVMAAEAGEVVFAWGNHAERMPRRAEEVMQTICKINPKVYVLGYTASGQPMHPVRLAYATELNPWTP